MVTEQMAANDHESFHLLQISESASDSLPDLDLVTLNTQHKKKKVRLKRRERNSNTNRPHPISSSKPLDDESVGWPGPGWLVPGLCCWNLQCVMVVVSVSSVLMVLVMSYITTQLHTRIVDLEHQLRMKISDDDSKSVPEKLQLLDSRIESIISNQTGTVESVMKLKQVLSSIQSKIDGVSKTEVQKEEGKIRNLLLSVSGIKQDIELLSNISRSNEESINNITNILASFNITTSPNTSKPNKSQVSSQWEPLHTGRP